jgi:hypothetical protein
MSKVLTFSRVFPSYHPRKGEPTYFVEKITRSLHEQGLKPWDILNKIFSNEMYYICEAKHHTIRAGHRWKVGDKFSPRVWSGKPYQSKQIIIAPDIEIKKVWDIRIHTIAHWINYSGMMFPIDYKELAKNDGLSTKDFLDWFGNPTQKGFKDVFFGQIICWNENIEY